MITGFGRSQGVAPAISHLRCLRERARIDRTLLPHILAILARTASASVQRDAREQHEFRRSGGLRWGSSRVFMMWSRACVCTRCKSDRVLVSSGGDESSNDDGGFHHRPASL
ncbi:hypothetical protein L596_003350 [Steinernema carpocapsae]|uniref:Uncharacterized protein n=1 Tax=Steinernema carpocapsae TaxID=34508 RepID=A0A4U8UTV3_STECR|nr:hypothetical protein L596_003350 [Steinernema carpocapsae]